MNEEKFILLKIRRKAYNVNNPVQAKRRSGIEMPLHNLNCVAVQPTTGLRAWVLDSHSPSCASLARGYQHLRPSVFLDKCVHQKKFKSV